MDFIDQLKKEHTLIVGFGYRTGLTTANYLISKGVTVSITDSKSESDLLHLIEQLNGKVNNFFYGKQDPSQLDEIDRVILSPGVPRTIPLIQKALERNIPVISEIELAYRLCKPKMMIGITGTDGKTTTTTLIHELLKPEVKVKLGGNIGIPFISFLNEVDEETYILLELSSYQLEEITHLKFDIASILNVSEDHLDRYDSFDHYKFTKKNIFKNQTNKDFAILNFDAPYFDQLFEGLEGKLLTFSKENSNQSTYLRNDILYFQGEEIIHTNNIKLQGIHNLENVLAAVTVVKLVGISNSTIQEILSQFQGLPHRNEFVGTVLGIDFINDSKATTINAVEKSLLSLNKPILLLMGGQDKGLNFKELNPLIQAKVKELILFGEAKEKIDREIQFKPKKIVKDLKEAFDQAVLHATEGDVVLLSPGCTSWDQYPSYEKRGDHFKELVQELKNDKQR